MFGVFGGGFGVLFGDSVGPKLGWRRVFFPETSPGCRWALLSPQWPHPAGRVGARLGRQMMTLACLAHGSTSPPPSYLRGLRPPRRCHADRCSGGAAGSPPAPLPLPPACAVPIGMAISDERSAVCLHSEGTGSPWGQWRVTCFAILFGSRPEICRRPLCCPSASHGLRWLPLE